MLVLGIESTCDESSVAVVESPRKILSNVVMSQVESHQIFGGVVPEIASRLHVKYLCPALHQALAEAKCSLKDIDLIAVASRPGLIGGLLVGSTLAKTLSMLLNKPLQTVDHLHGHLLASDLEESQVYPCIGGIFSGAHSNVYYGTGPNSWKLMAKTRDDAPGEAFDKVASMLSLPYPGGPSIQAFAEKGDEKSFKLPIPLPKSLEGDFSFSGLKTAVLYNIRGIGGKEACSTDRWPDLAASFQWAVVKGIVKRLETLVKEKECKHITIGGGVAANKRLRGYIEERANILGVTVHFPAMSLCMDNAAMIARAGASLFETTSGSKLNEEVFNRSTMGF